MVFLLLTGVGVRGVSAVNASDKRWLEVRWEDGRTTEHPYLWMRDNCTCSDCYHPTTLSRRFLMRNLDVDLTAIDVQVGYHRSRILPREEMAEEGEQEYEEEGARERGKREGERGKGGGGGEGGEGSGGGRRAREVRNG